MKKLAVFALLATTMGSPVAAQQSAGALPSQPLVVLAKDPESLFTSPDPKLHKNKQITLRMLRELVNCGQWDKADHYMTDSYIQHNPLIGQGRQGVVDFFRKELNGPRVEQCGKLKWPVVAVIAEEDYVTVMLRIRQPNPNRPNEFYYTTWFDTWRFVGDKVDEHWDAQKVCPGISAGECVFSELAGSLESPQKEARPGK